MCDPVTAMVAVAAGSGYSLYSQRENAKAQQKFYARARTQQDKEINQQRDLDLENRARRARAERSRLRALSAETGLTGITMSTLLNDTQFQSGRDMSILELNRRNQLANSAIQHQSNNNMISQPDYLGTALNAGLQIYGIGSDAGKWGGP